MPEVFGIPLIGFIQICIGAAVTLFFLIKFLCRLKGNRKNEYLIKNVHVITGDGREIPRADVYVKKGIISEISENELEKKKVTIIDGDGKTLMPGLIDCHTHVGGMNCKSPEETETLLRGEMPRIFSDNILPYGITTIKDLDAPKHFIKKLQKEIRSGRITAPELFIVGPNFTSPNGHPAITLGRGSEWLRNEIAVIAEKPEDITNGINELKKLGVDFLKFTYQGGDYLFYDEIVKLDKIDKPLMEQIIREGKEKGFKTTAHVFYENDVRELLEAGIYGIEHGILDRKLSPDDDIVKLWKKSGAHFVPTVNAMTYEKDPARLENSIHNLKVIYDAGIPVAMGTDSMLEMMSGEVQHRELQYYVEAGLTPMQAIMTATKNAAEHLGISDRKGTISVGKEADLILLDKDPLEDISYTQFINRVFLKGKQVYSQKAIHSYEMPDYVFPETEKIQRNIGTDGKTERILDASQFSSSGKISHTTTMNGEVFIKQEMTANGALSLSEWSMERPSDNTSLHAKRENGVVTMTGTFRGKQVSKRYNIREGLWYQLMDENLSAFVLSDLDEILFYSIGTNNNNKGALTLGEFAAKKLGEETVKIDGKDFSAVKISMVLTIFAWAWKGIYHFDKKTGALLQSGEQKGASVKTSSRKKSD